MTEHLETSIENTCFDVTESNNTIPQEQNPVLLYDRLRGKLCNEAARRGYVSALKWAREHGCNRESNICQAAAEEVTWTA